MKPQLKYGSLECAPAVWNADEAWVYWHDRWKRWTYPNEVRFSAGVLDELSFHRAYRRLPALPREAFRET